MFTLIASPHRFACLMSQVSNFKRSLLNFWVYSITTLPKQCLAFRPTSKLRSRFLKGYLAIVDQSVVSAAHLFVSLLLARYVTPKEYGIFVLSYAVLVLISYIQRCLVVAPMTVIGAPLEGENMRKYFTSTSLTQLILGITTTVLMLTVIGITGIFIMRPVLLRTFYSMAFASFSFQGQEFFRRMLFTQQRVRDAALNDLFCHCLQVIGLVIILRLGRLSACNAFWIILLSTALGTVYGFYQCKGLISTDLADFKKVVRENWDYGKWLLTSMLTQWVSGQIYVFAAAGFLTVAAAGVIGAARNIFGLLNMVVNGLRSFIVPYASKRFMASRLAFLKEFTNKLFLLGTAGVIIYCLIVTLASQSILDYLYKGHYKGYGYVLVLFAIQSLFAFLNFPSSIGLLILRKTKSILYGNLFSCIATVMVAIPMVRYWGLYGACVGMIITQAILASALFWFYRIGLREKALENIWHS